MEENGTKVSAEGERKGKKVYSTKQLLCLINNDSSLRVSMKKPWILLGTGGVLGLFMIIGFWFYPLSSKTAPKPKKPTTVVSQLKPRSAQEMLSDAEALMQRSDTVALKNQINDLCDKFPDSFEAHVAFELISKMRSRYQQDNAELSGLSDTNKIQACGLPDSDVIIAFYNSILKISSEYGTSGVQRRDAIDKTFGKGEILLPNYYFQRLLKFANKLGPSGIPYILGERNNQSRISDDQIISIQNKLEKVEWEEKNKENIKIDYQKTNKNDGKRNKILTSKYKGVRLRAESGSFEAMLELSEMLRSGVGCETNLEEANQWLEKFKAQGQKAVTQ